jgi:tetratricopeptide (TPR) repeat protein
VCLHSCSCNNSSTEKTDSLIIPYLNDPLIKSITEKINNDRSNPDLYFERAQEFFRMQKVLPAFKDIERAIELDPKNKTYLFFKADLLLSDGYATGAKDALVKILALDPYDKTAVTKLAKVYLYIKDYQNSLMQVKKLIDMDKSNFEPYFIAGLNYKEMKDTVKAIEQFKTVLQFKPDMYDAYMQLGLLTSAQKSQLATQYFDNAIRIDSTIPESYYAKAKYFQDINKFSQAKETYRKLISVSPQHANAFFNLGYIYIVEDSISKAKKYFDFAINVNPIYADAYYYRALCEYELGEKDYAKSDLTQCLALDPDNDNAQNLFNTLNKQ